MGSVLNPPRSSSIRSRRPLILLVAVGVIAVTAALFFLADRVLFSVSFVDRVTVVNPTPYHLEIEGFSSIGREQTKTVEDVIDQGAEWTFRFSSGGFDGGEVRISQDQFRRDGWRLTVPAEVAQRLQAAGLEPSLREPG